MFNSNIRVSFAILLFCLSALVPPAVAQSTQDLIDEMNERIFATHTFVLLLGTKGFPKDYSASFHPEVNFSEEEAARLTAYIDLYGLPELASNPRCKIKKPVIGLGTGESPTASCNAKLKFAKTDGVIALQWKKYKNQWKLVQYLVQAFDESATIEPGTVERRPKPKIVLKSSSPNP